MNHRVVSMFTEKNGWKVVSGLVTLLIAMVLAMGGWAWARVDEDIEKIEDAHYSMSDRISRLEARYDGIEKSQSEIKRNQTYLRDRLDSIYKATVVSQK